MMPPGAPLFIMGIPPPTGPPMAFMPPIFTLFIVSIYSRKEGQVDEVGGYPFRKPPNPSGGRRATAEVVNDRSPDRSKEISHANSSKAQTLAARRERSAVVVAAAEGRCFGQLFAIATLALAKAMRSARVGGQARATEKRNQTEKRSTRCPRRGEVVPGAGLVADGAVEQWRPRRGDGRGEVLFGRWGSVDFWGFGCAFISAQAELRSRGKAGRTSDSGRNGPDATTAWEATARQQRAVIVARARGREGDEAGIWGDIGGYEIYGE